MSLKLDALSPLNVQKTTTSDERSDDGAETLHVRDAWEQFETRGGFAVCSMILMGLVSGHNQPTQKQRQQTRK